MKRLSSNRKKTDDIHEEMARVEWFGGLYTGDDGEPCIPSDNLTACIQAGAKKSKLGKQFSAGVYVNDGPRDPEALWEDKRFVSRKSAKVGTSRIIRTRPIFHNWTATFTLTFDPELVNQEQVEKALEDAGIQCGVGDWRPRHGRFRVDSVKQVA